jgi:hypothetical protein
MFHLLTLVPPDPRATESTGLSLSHRPHRLPWSDDMFRGILAWMRRTRVSCQRMIT